MDNQTSRRDFIAGAAVAGAAASLFPLLSSAAQSGNNPRRIDVHHHFLPEVYLAYQRAHPEAGGGGQRGGGPSPWILQKDLEDMDRNGTRTAILSITTANSGAGFWFGGIEENRKVMRGCNEAAAKLRADHPGRFGSFAAVPMSDVDGALRETNTRSTRSKPTASGFLRITIQTSGSATTSSILFGRR
jgi:hypothetical protein